MAEDNGILEAENRVREMNRVTRQYSEQGNRFLQNMRDPSQQTQQAQRQSRQVRFEPAAPSSQEKRGQDSVPHNGPHQAHNGGTRQNVQENRRMLPEERSAPSVPKNMKNNTNNGGYSMFPDLTADSERLMLLLLTYLLIREKADVKLLIALGYILL